MGEVMYVNYFYILFAHKLFKIQVSNYGSFPILYIVSQLR